LNINADDAAEGLAAALGARALLLLSDVPGVLGKDGGVIPEIDPVDVDDLVADGTVSGGMEAKVRAAVRASDALDGPVVIASWREPGVIADAAAGRFGGIGTTVARVPLRSA
jgi:acetylglutamate kinase